MLDQIEESDLLSLIEGELSAEKADAIWDKLRSEPHVYQVIKSMCEDRNLLKSLDEPALPLGILEALEPQLARPMLMAPTNSELRYQGRKKNRNYMAPIAAGIGLVLITGVWVTFSGIFTSTNKPIDNVASIAGGESTAISDSTWQTPRETANAKLPLVIPPGSTIHHYGPIEIATNTSSKDSTIATVSTGNGSTQLVAAGFALVLTSDNEVDTESVLQAALQDMSTESALVRNFSYAEARRLADDWAVASSNQRNSTAPDFRAFSLDDASDSQIRSKIAREFHNLANRAKYQIKSKKREPIDPKSISKQLLGPKQLAPSFEQQLAYSMHGATYTIAIPASRLNEILSKLQLDPTRSATLKMLTQDENRESEAPRINLPTLADYTLARKEADRLISFGKDTIILLPIIIN